MYHACMANRTRVVITGCGAVSSLGTGLAEITPALRAGRSGLVHVPEWEALGLVSQVAGVPDPDPDCPFLERRMAKNAGANGKMSLRAAWDAITSAGLEPEAIRGQPIAVLIGAGVGSAFENYQACNKLMHSQSTRRINPFTVPHAMGSTGAANVSVAFGLRGESWAPSSACSTGAHSIGIARMLIQSGRYQQVLAGACEEVTWASACAFDAMRAISRAYNDRPTEASRPFDKGRDGFVISGGAGVVLLEELESAMHRGAPILAELVGFGANSDGRDMVVPWPEGAESVMREALEDAGLDPSDVDYINAHGTATPQGDPSEAAAMLAVFGEQQPWISSTKAITGHAVAAAGALEAVYTIQMLKEGFLSPCRNLDEVDESCTHLNFVREGGDDYGCQVALSNSFGFGGTNACLVLRAWNEDRTA